LDLKCLGCPRGLNDNLNAKSPGSPNDVQDYLGIFNVLEQGPLGFSRDMLGFPDIVYMQDYCWLAVVWDPEDFQQYVRVLEILNDS
jgi:hypothetical protein